MTCDALERLATAGVTLKLRDGRLLAGPLGVLTHELRELIRRNRDDLKRHLGQTWPDLEPGSQGREAVARWRAEWTSVWEEWRRYLAANREWQPPEAYDSQCRVNELVAAWNRQTGQRRNPGEVLGSLSPADYDDRELMTPGALALYVMTCLIGPTDTSPRNSATREEPAWQR